MSYPVKTYTENIERTLAAASIAEFAEGAVWYTRAHDDCLLLRDELAAQLPLPAVIRVELDTDSVIGAVAALSPQLRWERNIRAARSTALGLPSEAYQTNRDKAVAILNGRMPLDILRGRKVRAFYELIRTRGESDAVCIDSIAILVALGRDPRTSTNRDASRVSGRKKQLDAIERAYRIVAERHGLRPHVVQAVTWVHWRNIRDMKGVQGA